ncbi:MAG: hypothetical protein RL028_19 [Actinomycetota bacterium]
MHMHIEQHIIALVETNALEEARVDIRRILQSFLGNVKLGKAGVAANLSAARDAVSYVLHRNHHGGEHDDQNHGGL